MASMNNVSSDLQYFYEDIVYRVDKRGNVIFGIVMENDDQEMSEESSDSEENPKRKKGEIRVVWHPSGVEESINPKKVFFVIKILPSFNVSFECCKHHQLTQVQLVCSFVHNCYPHISN